MGKGGIDLEATMRNMKLKDVELDDVFAGKRGRKFFNCQRQQGGWHGLVLIPQNPSGAMLLRTP